MQGIKLMLSAEIMEKKIRGPLAGATRAAVLQLVGAVLPNP